MGTDIQSEKKVFMFAAFGLTYGTIHTEAQEKRVSRVNYALVSQASYHK